MVHGAGEAETPDEARRLEAALALTQEMCAAAQTGDWERLGILEAQRRDLLERTFAGTSGPEGTEARAECIRTILALDGEIIGYCESGLRGIASELLGLRHADGVRKAYHQVTGS